MIAMIKNYGSRAEVFSGMEGVLCEINFDQSEFWMDSIEEFEDYVKELIESLGISNMEDIVEELVDCMRDKFEN